MVKAASGGRYHGPVWGTLPSAYPTALAEQTYRALIDRTEDHPRVRDLTGYGFRGAALRFRTAWEAHESYVQLVNSHGISPGSGPSYEQDRALFLFFLSGLASLECFSFGLHALGAYCSSDFALDDKSLRGVKPESVRKRYQTAWADSAVSKTLEEIVDSDAFRRWKWTRNVVTHRGPPPKLIRISTRPGTELDGVWQVERLGTSDTDQPLTGLTNGWSQWLADSMTQLWTALEESIDIWDTCGSK